MRHIDTIFVHCAATRPLWLSGQDVEAKVKEIRRWHVAGNGWRDIGYHYIIDRDGSTATGRPIEDIPAAQKGHNTGSVAICLIGGHGSSETDAFADNFTKAQDAALRSLISDLKRQFPAIKRVRGHNEVAAKACPGFQVSRWLDQKPPKVKTPTSSTTVGAVAGTAISGAGGVFTALSRLDPTAQIIVAVCACVAFIGLGWILRERIKRMARGT